MVVTQETSSKGMIIVTFPAGVWEIEQHNTDFSRTKWCRIAKSNLEVDENTIEQIHVRNDGMLGGDAEVLVDC